jgi:hypothetical protein
MSHQFTSILRAVCAVAALILVANSAYAQTGYGVGADGNLFSFDVNSPNNSAVVIGPLGGGLVTEAIDFRPSSNTLYGIDIGPNTTTNLYTISTSTGAATLVGGFPSSGPGYDLSQKIGFDFNPTTLQGDGSMRIRLVDTNNDNLRINSATGALAAVDTPLAIGANSPFVDGIAYSNNTANAGTGTTKLYDMDSRNDGLYEQTPPNNGTLNLIGPFGLTIDAQSGIGFDIYTAPGTTSNQAYAVYKRPDAPIGNLGAYLLYNVNLSTGATTNGLLVTTNVGTILDFTGGFAVSPGVPEPASAVLFLIGLAGLAMLRRRAQ